MSKVLGVSPERIILALGLRWTVCIKEDVQVKTGKWIFHENASTKLIYESTI